MKLFLFFILLFFSISLEAQIIKPVDQERMLPTRYDRYQNLVHFENVYETYRLLDSTITRLDSLISKIRVGEGASWEVKELAGKINILEAQVKSLKLDSTVKNNTIARMRTDVSKLRVDVTAALKPSKIQGKAGEIKIELIDGVYVLSLDAGTLQKILTAEEVAKKIKEIK